VNAPSMPQPLLIRGARLLAPGGAGSLLLQAGLVAAFETGPRGGAARGTRILDAEGLLLAPGFIELQINGAAGHDLTTDPEELWNVAAALPRYGITAFLATVVSPSHGVIRRLQSTWRAGPPAAFLGAMPLGLHVEGPYINREHRGVHPERALRLPEARPRANWTKADGMRLVTLAPELPGATRLIIDLRRAGVVVSAGHSSATFDDARAAIEAGITYVTHIFNGMSPLHHRAPGIVAAALTDRRVTVGLIADGVHIHPVMVDLVWRLAGRSRVSLVSDASAALGMPPGRYRLGSAEIEVDDNSARSHGRLAGGVVGLDACVRNLAGFTGASAGDAVRSVTAVPARLLGEGRRLGTLAVGARADLAVLNQELEVVATIVAGRVAFTTERTAAWT
jgi:N-acetylglucosamine-6-phosphate deacetylase